MLSENFGLIVQEFRFGLVCAENGFGALCRRHLGLHTFIGYNLDVGEQTVHLSIGDVLGGGF